MNKNKDLELESKDLELLEEILGEKLSEEQKKEWSEDRKGDDEDE